ncbi:acylphosphatase [Candidatus Berkelbacteria bacterium]|nr:acylphosphatase [Candidatus Berkelbacteria bacterium]
MSELEKAVDITLSGKVTGVGFRDWVRQIAGRIGVAGWVRNNTDGTVLAHVEGAGELIDQFIEKINYPDLPDAKVDSLSQNETEPHGYVGFSIEY